MMAGARGALLEFASGNLTVHSFSELIKLESGPLANQALGFLTEYENSDQSEDDLRERIAALLRD